MTLLDEINSIGNFISAKFPAITVMVLQEPSVPVSNAFVVLLKQETRKSEALTHTITERQYMITSYGQSTEQVITAMGYLSYAVMNESLEISVINTTRNLQVQSFSFTSSFKTENDIFACTGTLVTQVRETRRVDQYDKINQLHIRTKE